jgi:Ni/Fe-hydrogenase subunit HybB-like protein
MVGSLLIALALLLPIAVHSSRGYVAVGAVAHGCIYQLG